mgnify:CR=1 FL=1
MNQLLIIIAVSCGGAFGALCRSRATAFLKNRLKGEFPLPTLIINLTSCSIAGIALAFQASMDQTLYLALTMGFLGGLSTLSTMNYEAVELVMKRRFSEGFSYLAITYASTIGIAAAMFALANFLIGLS